MGYCVGAYLVCVACNGQCLEYAFRRNRYGVAVVAQHIAVNHEAQAFFIVFLRYVECDVFRCAQLVGVFLVFLQLFLAEAACVGARGVNFVAHFAREVHHVVRCVESSAESYYNFLLAHFCSCFCLLFTVPLPAFQRSPFSAASLAIFTTSSGSCTGSGSPSCSAGS